VVNGSAKAWVNWNGTGVVAVRKSFNNSSITDNGVGDYTLALSNSMNDANYALLTQGSDTSPDAASVFNRKLTVNTPVAIPTSSQYRLASGYNYYSASAYWDNPYLFVEIQGDLA
jgi:hypothetical protein